ncbi:MAG: discoidin domain-containing protein [Clostridiales bacterium]|nr:discoidin domain-containing protein [Clostridiales bacterium]
MRKIRYVAAIVLVVLTALSCCFVFTGCYCQHKLTELVKEPSTCIKQGLRTAYKCEKCGKMFAYTVDKGLYEIKEREKAPLGKHTVSADNEFVMPEGKTEFSDMEVYSVCAECEEKFVVDKDGLIPFTPSDNNGVASAKHVREGELSATEFTFPAGTQSGAKQIIMPLNDSKSDSRANVHVPFEANESRYLIVYIYNSSDKDVRITYGAECYGEYCTSPEIAIPARGYATAAVDVYFSRSQPRSYHELTMISELDTAVTLKVLGYYYSGEKVKSVELTSKGRTEYMLGEKLDTDGITLTATYANGVTRVLSHGEYTVNLADKELTVEDTKVVVTYKKMTFSYDIIVRNFKRGENFARGKAATASEAGFNPSQFGLNKLTDGQYDNFNAWGSDPHDSAMSSVWVQIDLENIETIDNIVLYARHDGCYFPKAYFVEVSEDGVAYEKVFEEKEDATASVMGTSPRNILFDTVNARYVRITATELTNGSGGKYYLEFAEIEVFKTTEAN